MKRIFSRLSEPRTIRLPIMLGVLVFALAGSAAFFAPRMFAQGSHEASSPAPTVAATPATVPYQSSNNIEAQVEAVGKDAGPSVVNVTSTIVSQNFFSQPVPQQAVGSGFIYDNQGHIVTNYHVIEHAQNVVVTLRSGKNYQAKVVGADPSTDLAVLKIQGGQLPPPLKLGNSDRVQVGQFVVALGNPFGLSHTLTFGVISAKGRIIKSPNGQFVGEALQTDTPINPGNSGGPLITLGGDVVGINSQIISPSHSSAGIGFAIPVNLVKEIVPQLIAHGHAEHPFVGISGIDLSPALASILSQAGVKLPVDQGLMIASVVSGSPAAKAGLHGANQVATVMNAQIPIGGDIITAINGKKITSFQDLSAYVETEAKVGEQVALTVDRNGTQMTVDLTLGSRPITNQGQ
ncbi:MAG TPA: trypsin-like peptidase domain-containing protein [Spirochaetia bacterium]|nr:trypsin-like peptidase domain-containing protein [Spirochaetia bacterium]